MQPTPVFLPGESQGRGSLMGRHLWGGTGSDTTEVTEQLSSVLQKCGEIQTSCITSSNVKRCIF